MARLRIYSENDATSFVVPREGETKLGQTIGIGPTSELSEVLNASAAPFAILGLPEDIGVRANGGIGGAHTAWHSFLKSFLNIQHTDVCRGEDFLLLGEFDFTDWMINCADADMAQLRSYTAHIDAAVHPVITEIVKAGKIPLVIGGGHNNAYPLLKGTATARDTAINVINLDAHSDFRIAEGRHSGNGFRYAWQESFLKRYAILGLHEAYNSRNIVEELQNNADIYPQFWEDIFLRGKTTWPEAIQQALDFVQGAFFGVELDVDCIENVLSSAATPAGISVQQAMTYLYHCGKQERATYLHLPEGIMERADGQRYPFIGKLLSYLVQAFVKGVKER